MKTKKPGMGHHLDNIPLDLTRRLLDWCVSSYEGYETECWIWQGHCDRDGYGEVKWRGRKYRAVRVAYAAFNGELADGMDVDHLCVCRACINPAHLEQVDPFTNRVARRDMRREAVPI